MQDVSAAAIERTYQVELDSGTEWLKGSNAEMITINKIKAYGGIPSTGGESSDTNSREYTKIWRRTRVATKAEGGGG